MALLPGIVLCCFCQMEVALRSRWAPLPRVACGARCSGCPGAGWPTTPGLGTGRSTLLDFASGVRPSIFDIYMNTCTKFAKTKKGYLMSLWQQWQNMTIHILNSLWIINIDPSICLTCGHARSVGGPGGDQGGQEVPAEAAPPHGLRPTKQTRHCSLSWGPQKGWKWGN